MASIAKRALGSLAALALLLGPGIAAACSVCMGGQEEASRQAFVVATALLTFLPLIVIGIGAWWFLRNAIAREEDEARRIADERVGALNPHSSENAAQPLG
ncbi:MAG: hypothetical protein JRG92_17065 [Deltaproteobacteria bacterium]|jgi:Na+-driven multidrug efflux pump|nr:hypothetical protein [Deltaproteobacteria bacterium]MBW2385346.1 hypothetical protein [Deltaproteobacteria bacterium]MBW2697269.1 hypothetical protein [Deltaproteobacteria bacterium]